MNIFKVSEKIKESGHHKVCEQIYVTFQGQNSNRAGFVCANIKTSKFLKEGRGRFLLY